MAGQPDLSLERELWDIPYYWIAGVDEAGRGAWAGPVVAGAVVLPRYRRELEAILSSVRDSKLLSPCWRERCYDLIVAHAVGYSVGWGSTEEIDRLGIVEATRLAMARAIYGLQPCPDCLIIDALHLDDIPIPQYAMPKADMLHLSVSAASIVAKVARDRWMISLGAEMPGYGFERHKGYGTPQHQEALESLGPIRYHRASFLPIRELLSRATIT